MTQFCTLPNERIWIGQIQSINQSINQSISQYHYLFWLHKPKLFYFCDKESKSEKKKQNEFLMSEAKIPLPDYLCNKHKKNHTGQKWSCTFQIFAKKSKCQTFTKQLRVLTFYHTMTFFSPPREKTWKNYGKRRKCWEPVFLLFPQFFLPYVRQI